MAYIGQKPNVDVLKLNPQSSDPSNPEEGQLQYADGTAREEGVWQYKNGAWSKISGESSSGSKNYISDQNSKFESGAGDWTAYDDTGAFVDGTGGSPSVISGAATSVAAEILEGTQSLKISKSASDGSGEGIAVVTDTIDRQDLGRDLYGSLEIDATDANYTAGDLEIKAYGIDQSNSGNNKELTVRAADASSSVTIAQQKGKYTFVVTGLDDNIDQIRLALHLESDSDTGSAWDVFVDDVRLGPGASINTVFMGPVETFTPTGTWTTNTTYEGTKQRWANYYVYNFKISLTGAPNSATLKLDIPDGDVDEAAIFSTDSADVHRFISSGITRTSGGPKNTPLFGILESGDTNEITVGFHDETSSETSYTAITQAAPETWGNGDSLELTVHVPIKDQLVGNSLNNTEAALQTAKAKIYLGSTDTVGTTAEVIPFDTTSYTQGIIEADTSNSRIVVKKAGYYDVAYQGFHSGIADGTYMDIRMYKNGSASGTAIGRDFPNSSSGGNPVSSKIQTTIWMDADDYIEVEHAASTGSENSVGGEELTFLEVKANPDFTVFGTTGEKDLFQIKYLQSSRTGDTSSETDWAMSNLTIGKTYTIKVKVVASVASGSAFKIIVDNGATLVDRLLFDNDNASSISLTHSSSRTFVATDTTMTFEFADMGAGDQVNGNGDADNSYVTLIEHNNMSETSKF